jgi:hypothetical protein
MDLSVLQAKFEATKNKPAASKASKGPESNKDSLAATRFQHLPQQEPYDPSRHPRKQLTADEYAEKAGKAASNSRRHKAQKEFKARQLQVLSQKQQQDLEKRRKREEAFQKTEMGLAIAELDGPSRKGEFKREREDAWQLRRAESAAKARAESATRARAESTGAVASAVTGAVAGVGAGAVAGAVAGAGAGASAGVAATRVTKNAGSTAVSSPKTTAAAASVQVNAKGDSKRSGAVIDAAKVESSVSQMVSGSVVVVESKERKKESKRVEWCPRGGDVPFSEWILQASSEADAIVKLREDGTLLLGCMPVSNTHMTQRLAAELYWHNVSRVCGQGHNRCHEAEYRCRYYEEAVPVASPKSEYCKPTSLFIDVGHLSTEDLKLFAVGIGILYSDFSSHFSGNQLLSAARDIMNLLALRGVKGTIELSEWTFSGSASLAEFASNMVAWLRKTFKGRFAQQDLASTLLKMIKRGIAVKDPIAKTAVLCSKLVIDDLNDMNLDDNVVARLRITDAFWCELHHLRRAGVL